MRRPSRSYCLPEDADKTLDRAMEQAEQNFEAQIDSMAADDLPVYDPEANAVCTAARASAHRASADAGVHSSNTPPSSSKNENWIGAEDWLEWVLYVQWTDWDNLNDRLKRAKEDAAIEGAPPDWDAILFMGGMATVDRMGVRIHPPF